MEISRFSPRSNHIERMVIKPKILFRFALVFWGVYLAGCSTPAHCAVLNFSSDGSSGTDEVVVTDLGGRIFIHAAADSWAAIVAKVNPTFAWNGRDLMWIEKDKRGRPQFVLDEAYLYQPTNRPRQWVLLRRSTLKMRQPDLRSESPRFFYSTRNWFAVAPLQDSVPHSDHSDNYAVAISANRKFGTVYEIGWQREMGVGSGHLEYGRRIYVLEDRANHWHFLGEGPEEGSERGGGSTVKARVNWKAAKASELPLKIQFVSQDMLWDFRVESDDSVHVPDLTTWREFIPAISGPSA
jgi:hypothetical protein